MHHRNFVHFRVETHNNFTPFLEQFFGFFFCFWRAPLLFLWKRGSEQLFSVKFLRNAKKSEKNEKRQRLGSSAAIFSCCLLWQLVIGTGISIKSACMYLTLNSFAKFCHSQKIYVPLIRNGERLCFFYPPKNKYLLHKILFWLQENSRSNYTLNLDLVVTPRPQVWPGYVWPPTLLLSSITEHCKLLIRKYFAE